MVTINSEWEVVAGTQEKTLRNTRTGRQIHFSDDPDDRRYDPPEIGLAAVFSEHDLASLRNKYTPYQLLSGGS